VEVRHLRCFVAVAEELHFGRAAARLRLSVSPVSRTVAELERELGVPLFVRRHHAVELTEAGAALADEARQLLSGWTSFTENGKRLGRGADGSRSVRVGSPSLASSLVVDEVLAALAVVRPGVPADVEFATSTELIAALRRDQLDMTVAHLPVEDADLQTLPLARYESWVVVREDDDLAGRASLTLADLAGRRVLLIASSVQPSTVDRVAHWLEAGGAVVEQLSEADLVRLAQLVRRGRGVTLSGKEGISAQVFAQPGTTFVPLAHSGPGIELGLVWSRQHADTELLRELAGELTERLIDGLLVV
jgi:DNA-binding transcriptional LysR family regulator